MIFLLSVLALGIMLIITYIVFGGNVAEKDIVSIRLNSIFNPQVLGTVVEEEKSRTFKERLVTPFFESLSRFFSGLLPSSWGKTLESLLNTSGGFYGLSIEQFFGLCGVTGVIASFITLEAAIFLKQPLGKTVIFCLLFFVLGVGLPFLVLKQKAAKRRKNLQRQLPDVLDLLTVSVEAGLGFDGALVKLSERMHGAMVDEFTRMLQEMRMGVSRLTALRALAVRCNLQDVNLFTGALIQADKLGVSIAGILRIQSIEMREKRRQRAEEQALKAPIKMLFPLIFFIFPTLFIVLLGPVVINFISTFSNK